MDNRPRKLNVGIDSFVIGNVTGDVGNGSGVIGPTDDRGNTVINTLIAVGRRAFEGPGCLAIGAGAGSGAGASLAFLINQLSDAVALTNDPQVIDKFNELISELEGAKGTVDTAKARSILDHFRNLATLNGVRSLIERSQCCSDEIELHSAMHLAGRKAQRRSLAAEPHSRRKR